VEVTEDSGIARGDLAKVENRDSLLDSMLANLPGVAYRCLNDSAWTMLYISEGLRDLTGHEVADVVGNACLSHSELIHPDDRERVCVEIQRGLDAGRTYQVEYRMIRADGCTAWVWEQGRGVRDEEGRILFLDGVVIDATVRALAEQELRESHEKFRRLFELEADAVILVDTESGQVLETNAQATGLYGFSREEWPELRAVDFSAEPGETESAIAARMPHVPLRWHRKKDGTVFPVEIMTSYFEVGGRGVHLAAIREISGRLAEEEALRKSREQLRAVLDATPFPVAMVDLSRNVVEFWSKSVHDLLGYTATTVDELYRLGYPDVEERQKAREQWLPAVERALAAPGSSVNGGEYHVTCADGSTRDCELHAAFVAGRLVVTMNDITARKRAADELRASEERFRTLVEEVPIPIMVETEGVLRYANRAARLLFRESTDMALLGRRVMDLTHPDYRDSISERLRAAEDRRAVPMLRSTVVTLDGRLVEVESSAVPVSYEGDEGSLVFMADITERLKTEEALRLTQHSVDTVTDAVFWTDAEARIIYVSESLCRSLGYKRDELLGMTIFDLDPTLSQDRWREIWSGMQERGTLVIETVHRTKSGQIFPVEVATNRVRFGYRDYNCAVARDISERKKAEAEAARLNQIVEQSQNEIHVFDAETLRFVEVNEIAREKLGYSMAELLRMTPVDLNPSYTLASFKKILAPLKDGAGRNLRYTTTHKRKDGSLYPVEVHMRLHEGSPRPLFVGTLIDITDRVQAEEEIRLRDEQLQQAQKMEAIGRLAGGVAHDFNNLLTAVLGYSELILAGDLSDPEELRADVMEIKSAALRAKELTSQILAFSRRQPRQPRVVRANDLILESEALLRRTLGEDVELSYRLSRHAGSIEVDPGQFTQVLVNLAVNARDAMPGGGRLVVDTSSVTWDGAVWMRLTVADNGHGMDQETIDRVFEPFFTTKRTGEGTGLGLATVYGIVAQSGGKISVSSELGAGSAFTVLLPSVAQAEMVAPQVSEPAVAHNPAKTKEQATILVVEDEDAVRSLTARVLRENGYEVLAAADGSEAAALAKDCQTGLSLLLTDVVLPGELQGDAVARVILEQCPGIKTMFMSGYPREVIAKAGRLSEGVNYLEKPFSPAALLRRVKELIDAE